MAQKNKIANFANLLIGHRLTMKLLFRTFKKMPRVENLTSAIETRGLPL
jgi:hypothetical protein